MIWAVRRTCSRSSIRLDGDVGPLRSLDAFPNNLPDQLTTFVGRAEELVQLRAVIGETRLITLTGAGGAGKTRLALQLAADLLERFPDGVWWVDLAPISDPELVAEALAGVLGVRPLPGMTMLQACANYLTSARALVALDNCEHLLPGSAEVAEALLHACSKSWVGCFALCRGRGLPSGEPMFVSLESPSEPAWLTDLNLEQRAAAEHEGGHLLILAGAGTGKTTTLCARVGCLIEGGASPERILLLTFTRRAAREMIARAVALIGAYRGGARRIVGGAFHAMAHRFVRGDAAALGLTADFGLLDAGDAADLIDLVRQEQGHAESGRRFPRKHTLADVYSRTVNAQRPVRAVIEAAFPWCVEHSDAMAGLFRAYTARKRALGVLDLDDLLLFWRALARDPDAGARLAGGFDHVLIDEYQDVNELQVEVVAALAGHGATVTAVGDDFQAIYGFRSASADHLLGFTERFPGAATVLLERNYRGGQPLLDLANAIAAEAEIGIPKTLRAVRAGGECPELVFCRDQAQEAAVICDRVLAARERGMLLREQAVLARTGMTPTCSSSSSRDAESRSSNTVACATSRQRMSRTSWRCCD